MRTVPILIAAHVCSMLGFSTFAALLPQLRDEWSLSNAQAGIVGGVFFGGYIASVSYWTALTDRGDGRRVYAVGSLVAAASSAGFGWLARGFSSALFFQAQLDGRLPHLLRRFARGPARISLERAVDRGRRQSHGGAGVDRGKRDRAAGRSPQMDPAGDGRVGRQRNRARVFGPLALGRGAGDPGGVLDDGDGGV